MIVSAIVVLYHPNFDKLDKLYRSVINQVDYAIFVDNTDNVQKCSDNRRWIEQCQQKALKKIHYLGLNDNLGIAHAQNKGIEHARHLNTHTVLLLDQDSELPITMVNQLLLAKKQLVDQGCAVATIGPAFRDEKTGKLANIIQHTGLLVKRITPDTNLPYMKAEYIISSGAIIDIEVIDKVGGLQDSLFIDWVDVEWCLRAKQYGLQSFVIPSVVMEHCIGDASVSVGEQDINLHSDFRNYFIVRNSVYLALHSEFPWNFKLTQLLKTPLYILFYSYHSKKPFYSLKLLCVAVKDAMVKNMGKGYLKHN